MHSNLTLFQILFIGLAFQGMPFNSYAQPNDPLYIEREEVDDQYIRVERKNYLTSPAYSYRDVMISTYQVNVNEEGLNMLGDAGNEPTIAIDPLDPMHMVIGWRQFDTIASNFRQAGYAFTYDGGMNWNFPGCIDPGVFRSDPVLEFDKNGRFYYSSLFYLLDLFNCVVFRSDDGQTWDDGTFAHGGDKEWIAVDRTHGTNDGNIYSFWQSPYSGCDGIFTCSFDNGDSFEDCSSLPADLKLGTMAIGPSGELYACGNGSKIQVCKATSIEKWKPIVWSHKKDVDLGGVYGSNIGPNPQGLLGQAWIAVDQSSGLQQGNVYLLSTVAEANRSDIMFCRSTDGTDHWSTPIRINETNDIHWSWFGTMSVSPGGRIDVVWLDTYNNNISHLSALYFSYSLDGGISWSANKKLSETFNPHLGYPNQNKMGDYFHMLSDNEGVNLAWAATFNGEQDVYFSRILVEPLTGTKDIVNNTPSAFLQNIPNPFNKTTSIHFNVRELSSIKLEIYDFNGHLIKVLDNSLKSPGEYNVSWDRTDVNGQQVSTGLYIYQLSDEKGIIISKKMLAIN